jgi:GNAT superfamily N-acetyltransferase
MVLELQWESATEVFEEFQELFDAHFFEIYNKKIQVKKETFNALDASGVLFLLTARDDGKPIGYYACVISPSVYDADILEAKDVGIYVSEEYRNLGITTEMQDTMDSKLRELGVGSVYVSYPYETSIPLKQGYEMKEIIYGRSL